MPSCKVVVATHGHCFDGLVSAVLFTHLRRGVEPAPTEFQYLSCGYGPNMQIVPERWLRGDENAVIDFRFTPSQRLTWYFDHHPTAFGSPEEERAALERPRIFYDPEYDSCAQLIADVGQDRYGVDFDKFHELVDWAERIDGAKFESAAAALDRAEPVMQLASVIEQHGDAPLLNRLVGQLLAHPLLEVAHSDPVRELWQPLAKTHQATLERMAARARKLDDVVFIDVSEESLAASGKFYAYALYPDAVYSVALLRMKQHFKVSVGYNPWSKRPRHHDIAALCRQHGGGGHADVGAVSFALKRLDEARRVAQSLVDELNR